MGISTVMTMMMCTKEVDSGRGTGKPSRFPICHTATQGQAR
jgi:hypothetical protein